MSSAQSPHHGRDEITDAVGPRRQIIRDTPKADKDRDLLASGRMRIATCTEADLALLERHLPTGKNNAHAYHFGRQQAGDVEYLIAWIDDIPVGQGVISWSGFLDLAVRRAFPACPEIGYLGVEQHWRGRGVGGALVGGAEGRIVARGFGLAGLGVGTDNPRAMRLYERLGYRHTSMRCESRYTWFDDEGISHEVTETNLYLVKDL